MNTTITPPPDSPEVQVTAPYLQIQLDSVTPALIPMQYAQEVLTLPSRRITPMPNLPDCLLGLLNQRSRIIWVADLGQMLGKKPINRNLQQYNLAIIRWQNIPLGLVVAQVKGVIRLVPELIESPAGNVAKSLVPYLHGVYQRADTNWLVLTTEAIINSPLLHSR
ncbi:chemotaxis protein CheW [Pleurocapsa sp. PCC 7319]|uniref:chemotaxis protein CheW n=1 Tax=Pleurocapsa sp. PCC 7319 TaxID=118161 RepID=UPI000349A819|nr:chemotaxis protein CheW [Pleurocapsa sp. PCC 7319]